MTKRHWMAVTTSLALAFAAPQSASAQSPQEIYNAAQAAYDKQDWDGAIAGFQRIVPKAPRKLSQTQAVIAARLADAMLQQGRFEEAHAMAERAIASLSESAGSALVDALLVSGRAARHSFDYAAAAASLRRVEALARTAGDLDMRTLASAELAESLMTVDPAAAAAQLDGLFADPAVVAKLKGDPLAVYQDLRARAAMNAGDFKTARTWAERSVERAGGLSTKVNMTDISARTDAAIIYSLLHDDENTRRYMAYTGAGHLKDIGWVSRYEGDLPVCSPESGVAPADTVIVWFAIATDGHVYGVDPIYASHPGKLGETFARAVSQWHWDPDLVKAVEPFWRSSLVIQLRCASRPTPDGLNRSTVEALGAWLTAKGVPDPGMEDHTFIAADDPRLKASGADAIPALLVRYNQSGGDASMLAHIRQLLVDTNAPAAAYALLLEEEATREGGKAGILNSVWRRRAQILAQGLTLLEPHFPNDPSLALIRLDEALALEQAGAFAAAAPLLQAVEATPPSILPEGAPVRRVALLHQAIVARRLGDAAGGEAKLQAAGLTADQCSLFDTHPVRSGGAMGSGDFPREAMRWGFEGIVKEAFDIGDDGRLTNIRTVFAYPPFIFAPATENAIKVFRYEPPRIGGRAVSCTSQMQSVRFVGPH